MEGQPYARLEATVSGKVQLVMYRDFTQRNASRLKLTGEVQNRSDGTVRVVAEGPRVSLEILLAKLHAGPVFARVDAVQSEWKEATGQYRTFTINYAKD